MQAMKLSYRSGAKSSGRFNARHAEPSNAPTRFDKMEIHSVWKEYQKTGAIGTENKKTLTLLIVGPKAIQSTWFYIRYLKLEIPISRRGHV
mgnify:CR=1 FL=1